MEPKCPLQLQDGSWPRGFISQETTVRPGNKRNGEGRGTPGTQWGHSAGKPAHPQQPAHCMFKDPSRLSSA